MSEVKMIADVKHLGYGYSGTGSLVVEPGDKFTTNEGMAERLIEKGLAHLAGKASENAPAKSLPPVPGHEPVKVDGRTKAGREAAAKAAKAPKNGRR